MILSKWGKSPQKGTQPQPGKMWNITRIHVKFLSTPEISPPRSLMFDGIDDLTKKSTSLYPHIETCEGIRTPCL